MNKSTNLRILHWLAAAGKKAKKGKKNEEKPRRANTAKWRKMKRRKRKQKQRCELAKTIAAIQRAATAAVTIYEAAEPVIKKILKSGTKTNNSPKRNSSHEGEAPGRNSGRGLFDIQMRLHLIVNLFDGRALYS